jgi:hypothetical protein
MTIRALVLRSSCELFERLTHEMRIRREMGIDGIGGRFVIGMAGEIAVLQHAKPLRTFLNHAQLKCEPYTIAGRKGFEP